MGLPPQGVLGDYGGNLELEGGRQPNSIDEIIFEEEQAELLHKAIITLPEIQKRRFLLYYEYDLNYYEIGEMKHCTPQAVRRSVIIAREKIKAQMKVYLCA